MDRITNRLLNAFFYLLYHPFAWAYDFVAAVVSLGQWKTWVYSIVPFLAGPRILELGHGPGHLLAILEKRGLNGYGLDSSPQMSRQAFQRVSRMFPTSTPKLTLGQGENLPFANSIFQTVVATFPTLYITQPQTLSEVRRILAPEGQLIILLSAWITGRSLPERALALIYNITGESLQLDNERINSLKNLFYRAGFLVEIKWLDHKTSRLLVIVATKSEETKE